MNHPLNHNAPIHWVKDGRLLHAVADSDWNQTEDLARATCWECQVKAGQAPLLGLKWKTHTWSQLERAVQGMGFFTHLVRTARALTFTTVGSGPVLVTNPTKWSPRLGCGACGQPIYDTYHRRDKQQLPLHQTCAWVKPPVPVGSITNPLGAQS
jgi:hypothetical protein